MTPMHIFYLKNEEIKVVSLQDVPLGQFVIRYSQLRAKTETDGEDSHRMRELPGSFFPFLLLPCEHSFSLFLPSKFGTEIFQNFTQLN